MWRLAVIATPSLRRSRADRLVAVRRAARHDPGHLLGMLLVIQLLLLGSLLMAIVPPRHPVPIALGLAFASLPAVPIVMQLRARAAARRRQAASST